MAFAMRDRTVSQGHYIVRQQLEMKRGLLRDRTADLDKARKYVTELEHTCQSLQEQIADLEKDEGALVEARR